MWQKNPEKFSPPKSKNHRRAFAGALGELEVWVRELQKNCDGAIDKNISQNMRTVCRAVSTQDSGQVCPSRHSLSSNSSAGPKLKRGEKTPTPKISALLRKRPVLLRANFVLTKDRKRPYYGHFCGKIHRDRSCSKSGRGSLVKSRC